MYRQHTLIFGIAIALFLMPWVNLGAQEPIPSATIMVNQYGYLLDSIKTATIAAPDEGPLAWTLEDAITGQEVLSGMSGPGLFDTLSGDTVHGLDFSSVRKPGRYRLRSKGITSPEFKIETGLFAGLARDALAFFYQNRSGIPLLEEYAGKPWARRAGHESDKEVLVYGGADYTVNGWGGWYDAGDFGKYVVNGGISVWTLQNAWERQKEIFADGSQAIPENRNKVPDILDEARWELEFMLRMQIPEGKALAGMSFHKLHDLKWSGVPARLPNYYTGERYVYEPSTAATLNLAASAAQAARLWKQFDKDFADTCLKAARVAWVAAMVFPVRLAGNVPGSGGGNYDDKNVSDEFYWAAAELFTTTGEAQYLDYLKKSPWWTAFPGTAELDSSSMYWGSTAALGSISLLSSSLAKDEKTALEMQILKAADRYLAMAGKGYQVPLDSRGYVWGSNSGVLNNAIILALAFDLSSRNEYRNGVIHAMDYILGHNALAKSFVSGYGTHALTSPHHRIWANAPSLGYPPPPPGALAGGPNAKLEDPAMVKADLGSIPMAKRYLDSIESYASNEVAINWNAPLVWVSSWLDRR